MKRLTSICTFALLAGAANAQDYPLTIEHKFGTTVIETAPERVASVDYNGIDNLLALGVQPVAVRYWYGDFEYTAWPWAADYLESTPEVLSGNLNFEQIASTNPDVIIATWSGITANEYEQLSKIAPVVAVPEGVGDYAMPWDDLALRAGLATGNLDAAEELVAQVHADLSAVADRHPDWAGQTASVAYLMGGTLGAYTSHDLRPLLLSNLGFETPQAIDDAATEGNPFTVTLSEERIDIIDANVVIWFPTDGIEAVQSLSLRPTLSAVTEGREVFADELLVGAFSYASLLSLPYALEKLEPMIEAAIDGNPTTQVPQ